MIKLSIIIPCFNEEDRLPKNFAKAYAFFKKNIKDFEVILVDDGSVDKTLTIIKHLSKQYKDVNFISYRPNQGKGYAVKKGVEKSSGQIICFMDADFAIDLKEAAKFIKQIDQGANIVIANRNLGKSKMIGQKNLIRRFLGKSLTYLNNIFLNLNNISDTQCGFKFFEARVAKQLFSNLTVYRWLFDMEILTLASLKGYKIVSLPVTWKEIEGSKVNLVSDFIPVGKDLIKIYLKVFKSSIGLKK